MGTHRRHWQAGLVGLIAAGLMVACTTDGESSPAASPGDDDALSIVVSIAPQKYFVEQIGGARVDVWIMVATGSNPATYEPTPEQLRAISKADAYVTIGVPYENAWAERILAVNRGMTVVDSVEGIERQPMAAHHHGDELSEAEPHGEDAENLDPHVWLSPELVKIQAGTICKALASLDARHEAEYRANLDDFLGEIDALDAHIREKLAGVETRKFLVFHPAWGYFARDYDLEMMTVEVGGQEPSAAELAELITLAEEAGIKVVFAQPEFSTRSAEAIADEIGAEVVLVSPLSPDWQSNLYQFAEALAQALDR